MIFKGTTVINTKLLLASLLALVLSACATDKHALTVNPQKVYDAVNTKYPAEKNTLVFVDAPEGFVAPKLANCAVEKDVDNGDVVASTSALALMIIAGDDKSLNATTLAQALKKNKKKINGSKAIVIGAKETQKTLADLASTSGVSLEFIENPS